MNTMCVGSSAGRCTATVSIALGRVRRSMPSSRQSRGDHAPAARLDAEHAAVAPANRRHGGPLQDRRAERLGAAAKALDRLRWIGVAAVRLICGGADVLDISEWLELGELGRRDGPRVDADAA